VCECVSDECEYILCICVGVCVCVCSQESRVLPIS